MSRGAKVVGSRAIHLLEMYLHSWELTIPGLPSHFFLNSRKVSLRKISNSYKNNSLKMLVYDQSIDVNIVEYLFFQADQK